jgi:predicted phosphodiesterase
MTRGRTRRMDASMHERLLVLSDLHLARDAAARMVPALEPLLDEAGELVVNGDLAELHHPRHRHEAARGVDALRRLADRRGIRLTLIAGNHDPLVSPRRSLFLAGGTILLMHKDAVHPSLAPWSPAADLLQESFLRHLDGYPPQQRGSLDCVLGASRDAAGCEWEALASERRPRGAWSLLRRPLALLRIAMFWREYPGLVANFAARYAPAARIVVVGHSHLPGAWAVGDRLVLNTGAFGAPHRPCGVLIGPEGVELRRILRDRGRYRLAAPDAHRRWPVAADAAAHAASVREGSERPSTAAIPAAA